MRHVKSTVLAIVLAALIPAAGSAQEPEADPAATFSDLALRLPAQSFVIVTDQQGRRTTGRLIGIERDALSIRTDRALSFRQSEVQQVQRKIPDRVLDGGLIGFAIGMAAPLIVCTSISDSSETAGCALGSVAFGGLPGFAIGALIDRARARTVTLFRRPQQAP